jgi:hypothetical protein
MRFSEMKLLTNYPRDIEYRAKIACESNWRKDDWKPDFDEQLAIRHHRMTIALAMPQRKNHGL